MNWVSAHSTHEDFERAWAQVCGEINEKIDGDVGFLMVFVSAHERSVWPQVAQYASASYPHAQLCGGTTCGTIASHHAFEEQASIVAMAGSFSADSRVDVVHLPAENDEIRHSVLAVDWTDVHGAMIIADPFSSDAEKITRLLDDAAPGVPKIGGVLCGGSALGDHVLWDRAGAHEEGALLILLRGKLRLATVVAKGAMPIGEPHIIMKQRGNLIDMLDTGEPVAVITSTVQREQRERSVQWEELVIGLDVNDDNLSIAPPEYLMRGIIGVDPERGSIAVDASLRTYQTIRFHVRDAPAARQELREHVSTIRAQRAGETLHAVIVFNSEARDGNFFGSSRTDAREIAELCGTAACVGIFCSEEIGPAKQKAVLHQFSTTVGLLYEA